MNSAAIKLTAICLFVTVLPSAGWAQANPTDVTGSAGAAAPAPQLPPAGGADNPSMDNVRHVRQLVRDVEKNTDNIKSKGDFGAQLWLVQGLQFFQDWRKPQTPAIDPVAIAPRGQQIYTAIILYGIAHDTADLSNVSYDVVVRRPDGSVYSEHKNMVGWEDLAPASSHELELGHDYVGIDISPTDPAGLYSVEVTVFDHVSGVTLPLKQTFVVL